MAKMTERAVKHLFDVHSSLSTNTENFKGHDKWLDNLETDDKFWASDH